MAYTMEEFAKLDLGKMQNEEAQKRRDKETAEDAYWDAFSAFIDEHPIHTPGCVRHYRR